MSTSIQAVVFDLDGTLLDTRDDLACSVNHVRESYGLDPISTSHAIAAVGHGAEHLLRSVLVDHQGWELEEAVARFQQHYNTHCCDNTAAYPGVPELLAELRKHHLALAVATNKPQESAQRLVEACGLGIETIIGADGKRPHKPNPAMLNEAIDAVEAETMRCIYVGDMNIDLVCARAADCPFIGVDFGFVANTDLVSQTAVVVDTVASLRRALLERD